MENTTKALLIAAAVLVAIVIIALGILLIKNTSDTSKQQEIVGQQIGQATKDSTFDLVSILSESTRISRDELWNLSHMISAREMLESKENLAEMVNCHGYILKEGGRIENGINTATTFYAKQHGEDEQDRYYRVITNMSQNQFLKINDFRNTNEIDQKCEQVIKKIENEVGITNIKSLPLARALIYHKNSNNKIDDICMFWIYTIHQ